MQVPTMWDNTHIGVFLKPRKKQSKPIALLYHSYKLFEKMILNRVIPIIDKKKN